MNERQYPAWQAPVGADGFTFLDSGQSIWIDSTRIDECLEYIKANEIKGAAVSPLGGFNLKTLDFLKSCGSLKRLTILPAEDLDISLVNGLQELEYLLLGGRPKQAIDIGTLPSLQELRSSWWPGLTLNGHPPLLRRVLLDRYPAKPIELKIAPALEILEELELGQSAAVELHILKFVPMLRALSEAYMPKLATPSLSLLPDPVRLEQLEYSSCKALAHHDQVAAAAALQRLIFSRCGSITSLRFLDQLPH